jgi:hypothetical protein
MGSRLKTTMHCSNSAVTVVTQLISGGLGKNT